MQVDWTYDGCDQDDERVIERLWEDYQPALEGKLAELAIEPSELRLAVTLDSDSDQWEVMAALHLATRTLAVEHASDELAECFEHVFNGLAADIDREREQPTRAARRRRRVGAVLPRLKQCRDSGRSKEFFGLLAPVIPFLLGHARWELEALRLEGEVDQDAVEPEEIVDETLLRAWDRCEQRPMKLSLDLWLLTLLDGAIREYAQGVSLQSIEEESPAGLPEQDEQTSSYGWLEEATYPETIELRELLPGHPGLDAWERLDFEEKQVSLARLLGCLPREQRHALVLNAVEGIEAVEIADFQGRSKDDVVADIERAQQSIAEAMESP